MKNENGKTNIKVIARSGSAICALGAVFLYWQDKPDGAYNLVLAAIVLALVSVIPRI